MGGAKCVCDQTEVVSLAGGVVNVEILYLWGGGGVCLELVFMWVG